MLPPLSPGYLLVQAKARIRRRPTPTTRGVHTGGGRGSPGDSFAAGRAAREVDGAVARPPSPCLVGQGVRIGGRPFDGFIATVLKFRRKDHLPVLLNIMRRGIRAKLASDMVTPAYGRL